MVDLYVLQWRHHQPYLHTSAHNFADLLCKAADQAVFFHRNVLGSDLSRFSTNKVLCYVVCIAVMELHTN